MKYVYKPYSSVYPALFEKEKQRLAASLKVLAIEHIGSTSVPMLGGKGIIDIAVAIDWRHKDATKTILEELGYQLDPSLALQSGFF